MGYNRFEPGDCCLGGACTLLLDQFSSDSIGDYTQVAGTWSVTGGALRVDASASPSIITQSVTGISTAYIVEGKIKGDLDGEVVGLIFGYTDDDNYYRLELEVSVSAPYCGVLSLISRIASVETTVYSMPMLSVQIDQFHALKVCVRDLAYPDGCLVEGLITAFDGTFRSFRVILSSNISGSSVGFYSNAPLGTSIFDDLTVTIHDDLDSSCPDCETCDIAEYDFETALPCTGTSYAFECDWTTAQSWLSGNPTLGATMCGVYPDGVQGTLINDVPLGNADAQDGYSVVVQLSNDSMNVAGQVFTLYIDYLDGNNYHAVTFTKKSGNLVDVVAKKVVAGVSTTLGTYVNKILPDNKIFEVCWLDGAFSTQMETPFASSSVGGNKTGLQIYSGGVVLNYTITRCPTCDILSTDCASCGNDTPLLFKVTLTGFVAGTYCDDCSGINATFILVATGSTCTWFFQGPFGCSTSAYDLVQINLNIVSVAGVGNWQVSVNSGGGAGGDVTLFRLPIASGPANCSDFSYLDIPFASYSPAFIPRCGVSSPTCTLTAIAL